MSRADASGPGGVLTSPRQTNSEMLRGPLSGHVMIFIPLNARPKPRPFADLIEAAEAVERERLDQVGRAARWRSSPPCVAADRRRLEAPGAPAGIDEVILDRRQAHDRR